MWILFHVTILRIQKNLNQLLTGHYSTQNIYCKINHKQADEVVLLKKFMESVGTYGSEFKVGGFSGYLCEMLILQYGNFMETLKMQLTTGNMVTHLIWKIMEHPNYLMTQW